MDFFKAKQLRLSFTDLSKKGSIDNAIVPLVDMINSVSSYFTTSSCSGRICIFQEANGVQKKGCEWLYVTHQQGPIQEMEDSLSKVTGEAFFKFEPFVLHVQCSDIEKARVMHEVAIASGFRNSGISIGKKGKIITAVRSTHGLEVPLSKNGKLLITTEYLQHIAEVANKKMEENFRRIDRFRSNLQIALEKIMDDVPPSIKDFSRKDGVMKEQITQPKSIDYDVPFASRKNLSKNVAGNQRLSRSPVKNCNEEEFIDLEVSFLFDKV